MRRPLFSKVETVIGLDLSLQAAAACAIPLKWDHDIAKVRTMVTGYPLPTDASEEYQAERREKIAHDLVQFAKFNQAKFVGAEDYAFSQGQSRAHALGELGGVVKHEFRRLLKLTPQVVTASHARKVLLQHLPRKDVKTYVIYNVKRLGGQAKHWSGDEVDAFVVSNTILMRIGGTAMSFPGED